MGKILRLGLHGQSLDALYTNRTDPILEHLKVQRDERDKTNGKEHLEKPRHSAKGTSMGAAQMRRPPDCAGFPMRCHVLQKIVHVQTMFAQIQPVLHKHSRSLAFRLSSWELRQ